MYVCLGRTCCGRVPRLLACSLLTCCCKKAARTRRQRFGSEGVKSICLPGCLARVLSVLLPRLPCALALASRLIRGVSTLRVLACARCCLDGWVRAACYARGIAASWHSTAGVGLVGQFLGQGSQFCMGRVLWLLFGVVLGCISACCVGMKRACQAAETGLLAGPQNLCCVRRHACTCRVMCMRTRGAHITRVNRAQGFFPRCWCRVG